MASEKAKHVAIIGAGISGVSSAAHLLRRNVQVTVFERNSSAGGVWVYNEKAPPEPTYPAMLPSKGEVYSESIFDEDLPGPCHPGLQNNIGTRLMKTSLRNWPEGTPDTTTHDVLKSYIQDIAQEYDVNSHVRYGTNVLDLKKKDGQWAIRTRTRRDSVVASSQPQSNVEYFDSVIIAIGHYHAPRVPDIPGLSNLKTRFPTLITHSKGYRGAENLKDRNILLIGSGASAVDISRDAVPIAKKVYHSKRGGKFDVPAGMFPDGLVHVGEVLKIESVDNRTPAAIPAKFHLADGTTLDDVDDVILCTGYHISLPFLAEYHADDMPVDKASEDILVTNGTMYHNLHKDIFYIPDPSLVFIGVPFFSATFSLFDFQAQAIAAVVAGLVPIPSHEAMRKEYNERLAAKGTGKQFHALVGADQVYVRDLFNWVNPHLEERGHPPLEGHTAEWQVAFQEFTKKMKSLVSGQEAGDGLLNTLSDSQDTPTS